MFSGYARTLAEEQALKAWRNEFNPHWQMWQNEFLREAEGQGISRELVIDPRTLYQLAKLLQVTLECKIDVDEARKTLILTLLEQLKRTGKPPPVQ